MEQAHERQQTEAALATAQTEYSTQLGLVTKMINEAASLLPLHSRPVPEIGADLTWAAVFHALQIEFRRLGEERDQLANQIQIEREDKQRMILEHEQAKMILAPSEPVVTIVERPDPRQTKEIERLLIENGQLSRKVEEQQQQLAATTAALEEEREKSSEFSAAKEVVFEDKAKDTSNTMPAEELERLAKRNKDQEELVECLNEEIIALKSTLKQRENDLLERKRESEEDERAIEEQQEELRQLQGQLEQLRRQLDSQKKEEINSNTISMTALQSVRRQKEETNILKELLVNIKARPKHESEPARRRRRNKRKRKDKARTEGMESKSTKL